MDRVRWWQVLGDAEVAAIVGVLVVGTWLQRAWPVALAALLVHAAGARRATVFVAAALGLAGAVRGAQAWHDVRPDRLGPYVGAACLVGDPAPKFGAVEAVFELDGERFVASLHGSARRRVERHLSGECTTLVGTRRPATGSNERRLAVRHVVGRVDVERLGDWTDGGPVVRACNRVRAVFARGAAQLRPPDDALFAGLVIGDDRMESAATVGEFRAAGLSHLTAVSGQNVSYVLAAASPLLRRLRPWPRWMATLGTIAWFVAVTRFEASVLRAGVMAGIACTGVLLGREKPPGRVLAIAIGLLVLADPLLVWSVGFWLSVAATAGVALLSNRFAAVVPGPRWLAMPLGVTLAAQAGIAPVALLVFGRLPLVSIPANLLAVPIAGAVMLYGLPAGLLAGALPQGGVVGSIATYIQMPSALGTRWVAAVASLAARCEPPADVALVGWGLVAATLATRGMVRWNPRAPVREGVGDGPAPHHR